MTLRYLTFVALICAGQGTTAQDVQENPFDLPDEKPSLGDVSDATERASLGDVNDATERDSLTSIAAATAGERVSERLSAEDQAAIEAYEAFAETGVIPEGFEEQFLQAVIDRFNEGAYQSNPELHARIAEMVASRVLVDLLTD